MAVWSEVSVSEIEYTRIDADFYHPVYLNELQFWHRLHERVGVTRLGHLITSPVRTGHTPKSRLIRGGEECVRFIKTDTVRSGWVDFNNSAFLPRRVIAVRDLIPENSVVLTIIGATPEIVGRAAIIRPTDPVCVTNQNVAVITTNERCDPYFLTAYFQTKWGRDQVWRHSRRTEQVNLNCREVERVLVPHPTIAAQTDIGDLVRQSFESSDESIRLTVEAQRVVDTELGIESVPFDKPAGYTATLSETVVGARIDCEYFQPKYLALRNAIISYKNGFELLLETADAIKPNIDPSRAPANNFNYVELSQINSALGIIEGHTQSSGAGLPSRARRQVSAGDVIASAVVGSVDKVALISSDEDGYIASTGFFHFRPKTVSPEYMLMLVRSRCVSMQFQQQATGGILSAVPDGRLKYIIIPRFPQKLQDKVTDLVAQAHQAKRESDALLEQAKSRVQQLIEEAIEL